ncbi:glycerophosphodiester phosphodiesterase [Proteinivorax hydrogeniformans]|uniref:Glycerophosphodiester phosphodiesterase n=1 Tax=Proteinivorax hydrogeniformans TaxID=1826727 RepID=A0AAU8HVT4_9FIRM
MTKILAHRGDSKVAPENTIAAFKSAISKGVDGVEFDVQLTKDGVPIVFHDEKLKRCTNVRGYLKDYTYSQLKNLDCGGWFDDRFANTKIPTLKEVLELFWQKKFILNVELKNGYVNYPGIEEKVLELIQSYDLMDNVIISSFNHQSIIRVKKLCSNIKTGLLYRAKIYKPWEYAKRVTNSDAVHPNYFSITKKEIAESQKNNVDVNVFTVDKEKDIKQFIRWNVDILITNYPELAMKIRKELSKM